MVGSITPESSNQSRVVKSKNHPRRDNFMTKKTVQGILVQIMVILMIKSDRIQVSKMPGRKLESMKLGFGERNN